MSDPPIPEAIWQRMRDFLAAGRTGQLVLHVVRGEVVGLDATDQVRPSRDRGSVATT